MIKKSQIILAIVALILVGVFLGKTEKKEPIPLVTNFEECAKAGNPVMESYPRQCIHEGKNFVEIIEEVVLPPHSPTEGEDEPVIVDDGDMAPKCYVGGCSAQICSDQKDMASDCMYRPEYACYQSATCERQNTGQCGWTETPALRQCLNGSKSTSPIACTMDAKICPDGSAVGRSGPNCEFAPCP